MVSRHTFVGVVDPQIQICVVVVVVVVSAVVDSCKRKHFAWVGQRANMPCMVGVTADGDVVCQPSVQKKKEIH